MEQSLHKQIAEKLLGSFFVKEFPSYSRSKYEKILIWLEQEHPSNEAQLLSFIARAYLAVGTMTQEDKWKEKAFAYANEIKKLMRPTGNFGGPKHVHRAYFAIRAINDVKKIQISEFLQTLDWLKATVNSDGGWSQKRFSPERTNVESDVETTSTAIKLLTLFVEKRDTGNEISIFLERAVTCLLSLRKGGNPTWGEDKKDQPNVHATAHALRALILAEPYIRNEVRSAIIDGLDWLRKIQVNGGWGNNETAISPNIGDTTLVFTTLNRVQEYDVSLVPDCDPMLINCVAYLWSVFENDHWEAQGAYAYKTDSLQFTAILVRELISVEWGAKSILFYDIAKSMLEMVPNNKQILVSAQISPVKRKVFVSIRSVSLFLMIVWLLSGITPLVISPWKLLEDFFKEYQLLANIFSGALFSLITFGIAKLISRNLMNVLKDYLGIEK